MIIPRKIVFISALFMPLALAAPCITNAGMVMIAVAAIIFLASLFDLAACIHRGQQLKLECPEVSRCSQFRDGEIIYRFENPLSQLVEIEDFSPCLPESLNAETLPAVLKLQPDSISNLQIKCRPTDRGTFSYPKALFSLKSPWGLWGYRGRIRPHGEIRVYPDVFTEQKKLASLFLNRGMCGMHIQRTAGQGREFERLRDYVPGDSFDIISWKATARKARPVSKVFQIENTQNVYAIIDSSRFSMVKKDGKTNLDHYLASALILGAVAEKQKDKFGIIAFDSCIRAFVPAVSGSAGAKTCRDAIYSIKPKCVSPDYNGLFSFIRSRIPRRSLLFFLTDLSDAVPAEEFQQDIELVNRKHLCCVDMLTSEEVRPLFSNPVSNQNELYSSLGGHMKWTDLENVKRSLSRHGVRLGISTRDNLSVHLVNSYINIKRRQLL